MTNFQITESNEKVPWAMSLLFFDLLSKKHVKELKKVTFVFM